MREIFFQTTKKCHQFTNQIVKEKNLHLQPITSPNILCAPGKRNLLLFLWTLDLLFPVLLIYYLAERDLCSGSDAGLYHVFILLPQRYLHIFPCLILHVGDKGLENSFQPLGFKSLLKMQSTPHICGALLTGAGQSGSSVVF